ncbi:MAG TPA: host attachment protein [Bdellovibrionota bacterium]|nr:host attachment protein [Bdellovibrionota bacterium]
MTPDLDRRFWIVLVNKSLALVYQKYSAGKEIRLIERIEHPEGRLKRHEIDSDKPGRSFGPSMVRRHAYDNAINAVDHKAQQFMSEIASLLDHGRSEDRYDWLVIVANSRMHGLLKKELKKPILNRIAKTVSRDFNYVNEHEIPAHLQEYLRELERAPLLRKAG